MDKSNSVKKNIAYNILLTLVRVVSPLIIFPYVVRVLSVEALGQVNFSISFVAYFVVLATFGISNYAIRVASRLKENKDKLSLFTHEILVINILTTIFSYVLLFLFISFNPKINGSEYEQLIIIASISIFTSALNMSWFYIAIEEFKYIMKRSIFFQVISIILIFLLVKSPDDKTIYIFITMLTPILTLIINFIRSKNYIHWHFNIKKMNLKTHFKPILILFALTFSSTIYMNIDITMLGFLTNDIQVGLYSAAIKIVRILITLILSINAVLLPRFSKYSEEEDNYNVTKLFEESLILILFISVPAFFGLLISSNELVQIILGSEYTSSINSFRVLTILLPTIAISNLVSIQLFIAINKEVYSFISSFFPMVLNILLNYFLIIRFEHFGASLATTISEILALSISIYLSRKIFLWTKIKKNLIQFILASLIFFPIMIFSNAYIKNIYLNLSFKVIFASILYILVLLMLKNKYLKHILKLYKIKGD